jgi:hypothetical protein
MNGLSWSARGDSGRRVDGISAIFGAMKGLVPKEFARRISAVDVLREDDPIYEYLSSAFTVTRGGTLRLDSCSIFGLEIARAIVFALRKPAASRVASPATGRQRRRRTA